MRELEGVERSDPTAPALSPRVDLCLKTYLLNRTTQKLILSVASL